MLKFKLLLLSFVIVSIALFFYFDLNQYLNLAFFISQKSHLDSLYTEHSILFPLLFFVFYVFCATFSIPGAALLTVIAGFLFPFLTGVLVVSLGSTAGAALSFLMSRFLFKDYVQRKFQSRLKTINKGFQKEGAFYVFSLRLVPVFPFFLINLLMGVTSISLRAFVGASFLGMLPGTFVYVNAGSRLSEVESLKAILSVPILLSFVLLAGLPWIMKAFLKILKRK